jgi:hypothetical protein
VSPTEQEDVVAAALAYARNRWRPIPIPRNSKKPVLQRWQRLRLSDEEDIAQAAPEEEPWPSGP